MTEEIKSIVAQKAWHLSGEERMVSNGEHAARGRRSALVAPLRACCALENIAHQHREVVAESLAPNPCHDEAVFSFAA